MATNQAQQQINPIQAQGMVDSLMSQLSNANGTIAARDGVIAVLKDEVSSLRTQLEALTTTEEDKKA